MMSSYDIRNSFSVNSEALELITEVITLFVEGLFLH